MEDVYVYMSDLHGVNEVVVSNDDGSYSIFIDDKLSPCGRINAYQHAMGHIKNRDFEKPDIQRIEYQAHKRY